MELVSGREIRRYGRIMFSRYSDTRGWRNSKEGFIQDDQWCPTLLFLLSLSLSVSLFSVGHGFFPFPYQPGPINTYRKVVLNIEIRLRAPALNRLCQKACLGTNNGPWIQHTGGRGASAVVPNRSPQIWASDKLGPLKFLQNDIYWSRQKFWNEGVRLVTKWTDFRRISEETRYENGQIFKIGLQWIERMQVLKKPRQGRPAMFTSDLGPENILKLEVLISTILEEFQGPNRLEGGSACKAGASTL